MKTKATTVKSATPQDLSLLDMTLRWKEGDRERSLDPPGLEVAVKAGMAQIETQDLEVLLTPEVACEALVGLGELLEYIGDNAPNGEVAVSGHGVKGLGQTLQILTVCLRGQFAREKQVARRYSLRVNGNGKGNGHPAA